MAASRAVQGPLMAWASKRRFPTLLLTVGGLFVLNLLIPDPIPLVDELILGLTTLILARWKDRRKKTTVDDRQPPGITPSG